MRKLDRAVNVGGASPPDKQEKATQAVLEKAELSCRDWAA
jgi:hypothetical protein